MSSCSTRGQKRGLSKLQLLHVGTWWGRKGDCVVSQHGKLVAGLDRYLCPLAPPLSLPLPVRCSAASLHSHCWTSYMFSETPCGPVLPCRTRASPEPGRSLCCRGIQRGCPRPRCQGTPQPCSWGVSRLSGKRITDRSALGPRPPPKLEGLLSPPDPHPQPTWRMRLKVLPFSGTHRDSSLSGLLQFSPPQLWRLILYVNLIRLGDAQKASEALFLGVSASVS